MFLRYGAGLLFLLAFSNVPTFGFLSVFASLRGRPTVFLRYFHIRFSDAVSVHEMDYSLQNPSISFV